MSAVVTVAGFAKEYRTDFRRRRVRAVIDASFAVERGEIFGFVGPNGAGKTTTIRALMGLIRPTAGKLTLFGEPVGTLDARRRVGFLPESPYFYDYLTPRELCDLTGRLFGQSRASRRERAEVLLGQVGLTEAADRPLRKFSKGMLQRAGLAQALMNQPELVVLDEPMSGLDPIGRREVRDLITRLRDAGTTVFFSTHILSDVEAVCDRVAVIARGVVTDVAPVRELLDASLVGTDVMLRPAGPLAGVPEGAAVRKVHEDLIVPLGPDADVMAFIRAQAEGTRVISVTPRRETLEDLVLRRIQQS